MEVVSANLSLAIYADQSGTNFAVKVYSRKGSWAELTCDGFWNKSSTYEGILLNTAGCAPDTYYNISIKPMSINNGTYTLFELNSSREGNPPSGNEFIEFYRFDDTNYKPRLQVAFAAIPPTKYVSSSGLDANNGSYVAPWQHIQYAIDHVASGDRILVFPGTYTEDLNVSGKAGITLKSTNGAGVTVINGTGASTVIDVPGSSNNFRLGGVGAGFTIKGGIATPSDAHLVVLSGGSSGVTVEGNIINSTVHPSMGIRIGAAGASGLTISSNTFIMDAGDVGVYCNGTVSSLTVSGNNFTGPTDGNANSVKFVDTCTVTSATISGNTISGATSRIELGTHTVTGITYQGNTFEKTKGAIVVNETTEAGSLRLTNLIVTGNTFKPSNDFAFLINSSVEDSDFDNTTISIYWNNFLPGTWGSTVNNVSNKAVGTKILNAINNWWGNATGPYNSTTNPCASGVSVGNKVKYTPWLDASYPGGSSRYYNVRNNNTGKTYNSIQDAINAASPGNILQVYSGNYRGNLTINGKTNLTLKSVSGASLTTINGTSTGPVIMIKGGSNNTRLGGSGFTIKGGATSTSLIQITNDSGVTIQDNIFDSTGHPSQCISIGTLGATDLLIKGNTFVMEAGDVGVNCSGPVTRLNVTGNTFTGPVGGNAGSINFTTSCTVNTATISGNTIINATSQIQLAANILNGITYQGNTFNNTRGAILVQTPISANDKVLKNLAVTGNTFGRNNSFAFMIDTNVEAADFDNNTVSLHFNNFLRQIRTSPYKTVANSATDASILDATRNWWGSASGPIDNNVSTYVNYTPWINASIRNAAFKITGAGTDNFNATVPADTYVTKVGSGTPTMTCALYAGNPQAALANGTGKYYDVSINSTSGVTSLTIKFYYTDADIHGFVESNLKMYYWNKTTTPHAWKICSNQTLYTTSDVPGYSGYIKVTISNTTDPNLSHLASDLPFGPVGPPLPRYDLRIRALNNAGSQVLSNAIVYMQNFTDTYFHTVSANGWYNFTGISDASVTWWIRWQGTTVYYVSPQAMGQTQTIQARCKVTDVVFTAKYSGGNSLPSTGCQWYIITPNGSNYVRDGNPVTVNDLVNGTYNLRVKWMGSWAVGNVSWPKDVETSYDVITQVTNVVLTANDNAGLPLYDAPCYWLIQYPNGTTKTYHGRSVTAPLVSGTYKLGVKWQGTYVISNLSWVKGIQTSYTVNCTQIVNRQFTAEDSHGTQLWSGATRIWIRMPNGTLYTSSANSSKFTLMKVANGTYTIRVVFEKSKVFGEKSYPFIQVQTDFRIPCAVYSFTPILQDKNGVGYAGADVTLLCTNGTTVHRVTDTNGRVTIPQMQNGSLSIPTVFYYGHKVNQTGAFLIGSDLADWRIQFNGLSINQTSYLVYVHLNSTFTIRAQLVYSYSGKPVSGGKVGLLGASWLNATTDASGWATFSGLTEWQPTGPFTFFGINDSVYGLTYPVHNESIIVTWTGDFNIHALDAENIGLNNASLLIYNDTTYWKTVNTDGSGIGRVQNAVCQSYTANIVWKGINVGTVSFTLNRAVLDQNVSCTVYYGRISVGNLTDSPLGNVPIDILYPNEDLYGAFQTNGTGFTPTIPQIPGGTYKVRITYMNATYKSDFEVSQNFEFQYRIATVQITGVPGVGTFIYSTESTVTSIRYVQTFNELYAEITGPSGSAGHFSIFIPKAFLNHFGLTISGIHIFIDHAAVTYTYVEYSDGYLVTVNYTHSGHLVEVVFSNIALVVDVEDSNGAGLINALIKLSRDGYLLTSGYTDGDGKLTLTGLPTGNYTIDTYQRGILVKTSELTMTSDTLYSATCPVYDLSVQVLDIMSTPLPGCTVDAVLPNGTVLTSTQTDGAGMVFFHQMPKSTFHVQAVYFGFSNSTNANLTRNLNLQLQIPMLNILTIILLVFTVGGAIVLIGAYYTRKKPEGPAPRAKRGRKKKNSLESQ